MPWWMITYTFLFGLIVFINFGYLVSVRCKIMVLVYELLAGVFMLGMMLAYWVEFIYQQLNLLVLPAFILVLTVDIKMSVYRDYQDLGIEISENMSDNELELAGALSLIFASPAYITSGLVCLKLIFNGS